MHSASSHPDAETLRRFLPFQGLDRADLERIAATVEVETAAPGQLLIQRGSNDDTSFFLLDGRLRLRAEDGRVSEITDDSASARNPIAQLRPRHYDVMAVTPTRYLRIDNRLLQGSTPAPGGGESSFGAYQVSGEQVEEVSEFEDRISYQFLQDLEHDKLVLPSLPDVAARIGRAIRDDVSDAHTIAEMIQTDPVITAKVIKAANSALYGGRNPVETCAAAVVRLGTEVTHQLVLSFAMRELFRSDSGLLQQRMQDLWQHSTQVAAICYVLARHDDRFDPEHAMLVGLLHDIGVVAVLNYTREFPMEARQPEVVDQAIRCLRAQTGSLILRKWGFSTDFIVAALEAEEWMRNHDLKPDYCDLVIIAQLHSFVGTERALSVPAINEVPAHSRLALGELTPRMSLKILDEAKDQIDHAQSLLNL
ncbi:MAG TPA: HDOD domain-containing protein [Sedimenticola thiotaurini]|uniref:HDOD domain-containing protein n=1 Tax=Sedimenticola thiotaurini TaxID=1543721 RepID=A0A831W803_9GAMM|nr:HDOD domain-containing protein [Sedimenticola thiotaurini]